MFVPAQQHSNAFWRRSLLAAFLSSASRARIQQHGSFPCTRAPSRFIHSSARRPLSNNHLLDADTTPTHVVVEPKTPSLAIISSSAPPMGLPAPLSILPLHVIVRSLLTSTISSSPILLPPSLWLMSVLAHTASPLLNPDKNPLLRFFLKNTFYAQFCAGETPAEVGRTIKGLKDIGFSGVILGYAKEVVLTDAQKKELSACSEGKIAEECIRNEIIPWARGTLETVQLAEPGDFVALK